MTANQLAAATIYRAAANLIREADGMLARDKELTVEEFNCIIKIGKNDGLTPQVFLQDRAIALEMM